MKSSTACFLILIAFTVGALVGSTPLRRGAKPAPHTTTPEIDWSGFDHVVITHTRDDGQLPKAPLPENTVYKVTTIEQDGAVIARDRSNSSGDIVTIHAAPKTWVHMVPVSAR